MAQQVEHVLGKDGVTGSNPVSSSKKAPLVMGGAFLSLVFVRCAHSTNAPCRWRSLRSAHAPKKHCL